MGTYAEKDKHEQMYWVFVLVTTLKLKWVICKTDVCSEELPAFHTGEIKEDMDVSYIDLPSYDTSTQFETVKQEVIYSDFYEEKPEAKGELFYFFMET